MPFLLKYIIGHDISYAAPGQFHVRSRQIPMAIAAILIGVLGLAAPLAFVAEWFAGGAPLSQLSGRSLLIQAMAWLAIALLAGIGCAALWIMPVREELRLSRQDGTGVRISRNLFGLHAQVRDDFSWSGRPTLKLWTAKLQGKTYLKPMLIDADGQPHALSFDSVLLWQGKAATTHYLDALFDYLGQKLPKPVATPERAQSSALIKGKRHPALGQNTASVPNSSAPFTIAKKHGDMLRWPVRLLVLALGIFLTLLAIYNATGLISGLLSGRLSTSFYYSNHAIVYTWATAPWEFMLAAGGTFVELLICASVAYGCLKVSLRGLPRQPR